MTKSTIYLHYSLLEQEVQKRKTKISKVNSLSQQGRGGGVATKYDKSFKYLIRNHIRNSSKISERLSANFGQSLKLATKRFEHFQKFLKDFTKVCLIPKI